MKSENEYPWLRAFDRERQQRRLTILYLCILLALLILLVTASYTWFSLSRTPRVSDMSLFISTRTGLELATVPDAPEGEWGQSLSFPDLVSEAAPLKPVTWSQERQRLLAVQYGWDGRMTGAFDALTDEENANRTDGNGYYVVGTFYARSGENLTVSLAKAVELNGGKNGGGTYVVGTPIWNADALRHEDGGLGAETAIRLGFRITKISPTGEGEGNPSTFYIYEPNADRHIDGSTGYLQTPSVDGADALTDKLICQSASTWTEADPVQRDVTVKYLGEFTTDTELFTILAGEIYEIKLYIWLEGQDVDCTNSIKAAQITANIQFSADNVGNGGMVEIPEETQGGEQ